MKDFNICHYCKHCIIDDVLHLTGHCELDLRYLYPNTFACDRYEDRISTYSEDKDFLDLCSICKHGDNCERSDKGISFANHSACWKFER